MDQFLIESGPPGHAWLCCHGALDLASRADLGAACARALELADVDLVVDLSAVEFLDCGSIRLLADTGHLQRQRRAGFTVVCDNDFVLDVLDLAGFGAQHRVRRVRPDAAAASAPPRDHHSGRRAG